MATKYLITKDKEAVEAKLFANAIRDMALTKENILYNIKTKKKDDISDLDDSDLVPDKYPVLGYKQGVLNTDSGKGTKIELAETEDNTWCFIQKPDKVTKDRKKAKDGDVVEIDRNQRPSKYVLGIEWDSQSNEKPKFKEEE